MKTKLPREKYVISMPYDCKTAYIRKLTTRHAFWTYDLLKAKIFRYKKDAEQVFSIFSDTGDWAVTKVA